MKKGTLLIILGVVLTFILWGISKYNGFVGKEETVTAQWANVENVYQRRADLIPNLVATVKGYAEHEQSTLTAVIEARAKATSVTINANELTEANIAAFQQAQDGLSSALSRLLVSVERYPDLKANQNFLELQAQLEGTENRIAVERRKYNEVAQTFNTAIRRFPSNIIASISGFEKKGYFKAAEGSEKAPEVQF
ncbi:MAG: LemA family protein [Bacteroidales bacterium]|jgi:LemA protein|nr:LemA family protein [Bacteroidales bacterium]